MTAKRIISGMLVLVLPIVLLNFPLSGTHDPISGSSDINLSAIDSGIVSVESSDDFQARDAVGVDLSAESQCSDITDFYFAKESRILDARHSFSFVSSIIEQTPICLESLFATAKSAKFSVYSLHLIQTENSMFAFLAVLLAVFGILVPPQSERTSAFSSKFKKRRSRMDVFAEILRVSIDGSRKTHIIQSANLNSRIVEGYLLHLQHAGLLQRLTPTPVIFMTTARGRLYLLFYLRMKELLDREVRKTEDPLYSLQTEKNRITRSQSC